MNSATFSVELNFNNTVYKQTDEVTIRPPLGPALSNIFVGNDKEELFCDTRKLPIYFKYVDNTFAIFNHKTEADKFLTTLNCLHPHLKFTFEKEKNKCQPFLDICVERTHIGFETSVYRKPTFTGQYIRWGYFDPLNVK